MFSQVLLDLSLSVDLLNLNVAVWHVIVIVKV
jgi:hypothetical protein